MHQWLDIQRHLPTCPVCKAGCTEESVIPIYGRGSDRKDPRTVPRRPQGRRPEPRQNFAGFGPYLFGNGGPGMPAMAHPGVQIAFGAGFGFMPALFGFHYVLGQQRPNMQVVALNTPQDFLSRLMLMVGLLVLVVVLFY